MIQDHVGGGRRGFPHWKLADCSPKDTNLCGSWRFPRGFGVESALRRSLAFADGQVSALFRFMFS